MSEIRNKPVELDMEFIEQEKANQLKAIKQIFEQIL